MINLVILETLDDVYLPFKLICSITEKVLVLSAQLFNFNHNHNYNNNNDMKLFIEILR